MVQICENCGYAGDEVEEVRTTSGTEIGALDYELDWQLCLFREFHDSEFDSYRCPECGTTISMGYETLKEALGENHDHLERVTTTAVKSEDSGTGDI